MNDLDDYQSKALRTASSVLETHQAMIYALGIVGEAGEVAELVKKEFGHGHPRDSSKMAKELGDVLWYVSVLANEYGYSLSTIARLNIKKLEERYPEGFSSERSLSRSKA